MKKKIIIKIIEKYSYFVWLLFLIFFTVFVTYFYNQNKQNQIDYLNKSLKNIYLNNTIKKITSELKPRYINIEYDVKQGDTYQSIINNLNVPFKHFKTTSVGYFREDIFSNNDHEEKLDRLNDQFSEEVTLENIK